MYTYIYIFICYLLRNNVFIPLVCSNLCPKRSSESLNSQEAPFCSQEAIRTYYILGPNAWFFSFVSCLSRVLTLDCCTKDGRPFIVLLGYFNLISRVRWARWLWKYGLVPVTISSMRGATRVLFRNPYVIILVRTVVANRSSSSCSSSLRFLCYFPFVYFSRAAYGWCKTIIFAW